MTACLPCLPLTRQECCRLYQCLPVASSRPSDVNRHGAHGGRLVSESKSDPVINKRGLHGYRYKSCLALACLLPSLEPPRHLWCFSSLLVLVEQAKRFVSSHKTCVILIQGILEKIDHISQICVILVFIKPDVKFSQDHYGFYFVKIRHSITEFWSLLLDPSQCQF